ncbi:MarR family transcriptional regulator [Halobacteriales archaeon QH_7_65_31]|nr:MAG: MarR family transcriptional regulator [Halobacteriales archaeon QH_7_65_31]
MPIEAEAFEQLSDDDQPRPGTNAAKLLEFLRTNAEMAFTQSELADRTDVTAGSVGPTLVRLRERDRVDHHGNYWRLSDHETGVDAATGHASATLAARESDDETPVMADWHEHAVDPREQRRE